MSLLAVPRMPSVSQVSSTVTPLVGHRHRHVEHPQAVLGSLYVNIVDMTVPAGDWLANTLRPFTT